MKSNLFCLFMLLLVGTLPAFAQPQLQGTDATSLVGATYQLSKFDSKGVNPGADGSTVTWDFSTLGQDTVVNAEIMLPASTPHADSFTLSNLCFRVGDDYYYYLVNNFEFNNSGFFVDNILFKGDGEDPQRLMNFPVTYSSTLNDDFTSSYQFLNSNYERFGSSIVEADAYGDLDLPNSTYSNVLRLKIEESFKDSTNIWGLPVVTTYETKGYSWYTPGIYYPVLYIAEMIRTGPAGSDTLYFGTYTTNQVTGIKPISDKANQQVQVFPNPASDVLYLRHQKNSNLGQAQIQIMDPLGKLVWQEQAYFQGGDLELNLSEIPSGIYWLSIESPGQASEVHTVILH